LISKTFPLIFTVDFDRANYDNAAKVIANVKIAEISDDVLHTFVFDILYN